ncbi:MAG: ABC transporter ATP-binding protein [Acidimicrobiales bacterium]
MTRLLRNHLRPYHHVLAIIVVLQAVQALSSLYLPTLNADIIDNGVLTGDTGHIWSTGVVMLLATAVQVVFSIAAVYFAARAAMGFGRDVRSSLFNRVTDFSAREVNTFGAHSLITRITNDVQQVQMLLVMFCTMGLAAPITVVGGVFLAMHQEAGLGPLLGASLLALAVAVGLIIARMIRQFRLMQLRIDSLNRVLREQITGMRVVRAFVREPEEEDRFGGVNDDLTGTSIWAGRLMALMFPTLLFILNMSSIGVLWFGADRIASGAMSLGSLVAFLSYFSLILIAMMMASFVVLMTPRAAVCGERIQEVLDTYPSVEVAPDAVRELVTAGSLELRDAGFRYPGAERPVLSGISFRSRPGETTAVIGSTGSGKTTLVNLIARLVDVTSGAVLVDGVDLRDLHPEVLWERIGLVPQTPYLFSGTVASNLRYGKPDATAEQMWEALEVAQAADFVRAMPGGLDAAIAQGGSNVSGGQRQRLAIARALVRKPEIYVFDDSFSALDLATDARLRAALVPYTADATTVIIGQRIATIADADRILVLEDGEAVGLGTHEELLETCATYIEIVESQMAVA